MWNAGDMEHTFAARAPAFEEKFPHIKLSFEPSSEYLVKLAVLFSSNSVGDLVFLEADDEAYYAFWAAQGVLKQLDPFIKRDKYDLNVFFPTAIQSLKIVDGKIWALPYKAFMARCGLFYNAAVFQQNGLPLPTDDWTYDDIARTAQRLTKRSGWDVDFWGGGRNFGGDFSFMAITRAFGGDLYTPDGKKTLIAGEPSRQAISWWLDRYRKDRSVALDPGTTTPRTLMEQGKLAFAMGYNPGDRIRVANALNPAGVPWGLSLMPKGPSGRRGGAFFLTPTGMPKSTTHPDEAWEFQKFLAEKETGVVMGFPSAVSGQDLGPLRSAQRRLQRSACAQRAGHAAGRDGGAGPLDGTAGALLLRCQLPGQRRRESAQRRAGKSSEGRRAVRRRLLPEPGQPDSGRAG